MPWTVLDQDTNQGKPFVRLTLQYDRVGGKWSGVCCELRTSTLAPTLNQCQADLADLVVKHLNLLESVGNQERYLRQWGVEIQSEDDVSALDSDAAGEVDDSSPRGSFLQPVLFTTR